MMIPLPPTPPTLLLWALDLLFRLAELVLLSCSSGGPCLW